MRQPRITIVTPSLNQAQFIEETIQSVVTQDYENLEYFVVDGGSTDDSIDIIRKHAHRIAWWVSEADSGQADALNKGFRRASGDVLGFLNADDIYYAETLARVARAWDECPRKRDFWVAFPVMDFDASGDRVGWLNNSAPEADRWLDLRAFASLHQPGVFWSRDLYESAGGFDSSYKYAFDREYFVKLLIRGHKYTRAGGAPVARFRIHEKAKSDQLVRRVWSETEFFAEFLRIGKTLGVPSPRSWIRELRRRELQVQLSECLDEGAELGPALRRMARLGLRRPRVFVSRFFWGCARRSLRNVRVGAKKPRV